VFKQLSIVSVLIVAILYLLLFPSLLFFLDKPNASDLNRIAYSIVLSLSTATISTLIAMLIGIPASYALSRYDFFGKNFIDALLELPLVVSPLALGAIVLLFFNNPIGRWLANHGITPIFQISGIVVAQFITVIGVAIRMIKQAFDSVPKYYENVSRSLGANSFKAFTTVIIPLSKKGILAAFMVCFAKSIGEFGATLMIAGSMPFKTETVPIGIFLALSNANITRAVWLIVILTSIGLISLILSRRIIK